MGTVELPGAHQTVGATLVVARWTVARCTVVVARRKRRPLEQRDGTSPSPRVPGMGMDLQPERRLPERVTTTVVKPKARAGDCRAGRRVDRRDDRTNRNGQRGQARAMSVLGNTKSDRHRKARGVESGGAARESMHLTRGDLPVERRAEVSRGRSSEEGRESGWSEGPKAQETGWQPDSVSPNQRLAGRRSDGPGRGAAGGLRRSSRPEATGRRGRKVVVKVLNDGLPVHPTGCRGHAAAKSTCANRRMRENRTSGGVGGVTGAIPSPRPDRSCRV